MADETRESEARRALNEKLAEVVVTVLERGDFAVVRASEVNRVNREFEALRQRCERQMEQLAEAQAENQRLREELANYRAWLKHDIDDLGTPDQARADLAAAREDIEDYRRRLKATSDEYNEKANDLAAARAEVERLDSWDGLLSILDEHYPAEVFEKSSDPGARIVTLTRHLAAAREREGRLEKQVAWLYERIADTMDAERFQAFVERQGAALAREDGDV